ncbi:MAG TPA: hypothetical protein DEO93_11025 [Stenotrophomonas sp.]|nr:hypothetical protein [Stenotrophomonas sp.]
MASAYEAPRNTSGDYLVVIRIQFSEIGITQNADLGCAWIYQHTEHHHRLSLTTPGQNHHFITSCWIEAE